MAKQIQYQSLRNLGLNGLNTQSNPASLDVSYLVKAENVVIRESGRIALRKGFKQKVAPNEGVAIKSLVEHNDNGTNKIFASFGTSIYTVDFTSPNAAFPSSGADVKHTVANTDGNWQFINFNNRLHCLHEGVVPQRYDGSAASNEKWSNTYATNAVNLANGSTITAPNIVKDKSYQIVALNNTDFTLLGANHDEKAGDVFTANKTVSDALGVEITADKIASGKSYKIIALGNSDFTNQSAGSNVVGVVFTANTTGGTGTGTVAEVITGTTGTVVEIKTNPTLTTITVDSTTGFTTSGKILIDNETITYTGKTSTTFTGCVRGSSNTTATHHLDNAVVTTNTAPPTVTAGEFKPSCGTGFYGRLWVGGVAEEKDVLHYSSLLDGDDFTLINGGGAFDLKNVWGKDDIVAIAPFYGQLAVFGKNNIAIYERPDSVSNMRLNEVIRGIGCIARDSVQAIGDDLVFLSSTGLRSLARTSEKDKVPLTDLSANIKDTLIRNIGQSTAVKTAYIENEGIYIMTFTASNITYVFDFKHLTPNQAPRITTWTFTNDREPASITYTNLYGMLVGQKDGGIATYNGYYDCDLAANGSTVTNASYTGDFETVWINLGESVAASLLKKLFLVIEGGSGATLSLNWYRDFSSSPSNTISFILNPVTTGIISLWGAISSLYGATTATHTHNAAIHAASSRYAPIYGLHEYRKSITGSAKNLKISIRIQSNGYDASLQDLTILHKQGKIR
tara:strand:+ start:590 stop:2797 length:2208 start_codon:yes stop_codon:yes gene_type:complete